MRRVCFVVLLTLSCACRESADVTQTIIWLEAADGARDKMALVRVRADGPSGDMQPMAETRDPEWPVKLVLAPKDDDPDRRFTLQVEALDAAGDRLMTVRFATGFVANESRYAKLVIHEPCVRTKAICAADEECNLWRTNSAPDDLGRSKDDPRVLEITCGRDPSPMAGAGGSAGAAPMGGTGGAGGSAGSMAGSSGAGSGGAGSGAPCATGYVSSSSGCTDVDECATGSPCGDHGECNNIPGSYLCECETGHQSRGGTCVPSSDCRTDNGGCEQTCDNSSGFAVCACEDGEWLLADRKSCAGFRPTQRVDRDGSIAPTQPQFAFDADGNGLAVWLQTEIGGSGATTARVWTRRFEAGRGWAGMPKRLDTSESGNATAPRVALAANGSGVVVWMQRDDGGDGDMWAADVRDGKVEEPIRIDEQNTGSVSEATVALAPNGDGWAAWTQNDGARSEVWVNRFSAEDGWQGAEAIDTPEHEPAGMGNQNWNPANGNWGNWGNWNAAMGGAFAARIAVDADGGANVVWTEVTWNGMSGVHFAPWASRYDPSDERWRMPVRLDETGTAGMPDTQLFGDGRGLAVWGRATAGRVSIRAGGQMSDGAWSDSVNIASLDSELTSVVPRLSLSPLGSGAAIWAQYQTPNVYVWANRYDGSSDTWSGAVQLSMVETTTTPLPQIAVGPSGDGFGVWAEIRGTAREIKAARLQSDAGFIGNATLATDTTAAPPLNSPAQIAVDPRGHAMSIWDTFEMGQYWVWSSAFD